MIKIININASNTSYVINCGQLSFIITKDITKDIKMVLK